MSQAYSDNQQDLLAQWTAAGGVGQPLINSINGGGNDGTAPLYYITMPTAQATPAATAPAAPVSMPTSITPTATSVASTSNPLTTQSLAGGPVSGGDLVSQLQGQYAQNSGVTPQSSWATGTFGTGLGSVPGGLGGAQGGPTPVGGYGGTGTGTWGQTSWPGGWLPPGRRDAGGTSWQNPSGGSTPADQQHPNALMQVGGANGSPMVSAGYAYDPVNHDPFAPPGA